MSHFRKVGRNRKICAMLHGNIAFRIFKRHSIRITEKNPASFLPGFLQSLRVNPRILARIKLQPFPSNLLFIHYWLHIQFRTISEN